MNSNTGNKRPQSFDPREEAKKPAKKTKGPTTLPKPKAQAGPTPGPSTQPETSQATGPDPGHPDMGTSTYRTEQEMEAEARQTALDLGFVLLLSENPEKALETAKTEFEKEEALRAIQTKKVVRHPIYRLYLNNLPKITSSLQNAQFANRSQTQPQPQPDLNNNAFPNLQAHSDQTPTPTAASNQEAMNIQFKRLQQQQQAAAERQKKLDALVQAKRAERQATRTPSQNTGTDQENKGEKEKNLSLIHI